MSTDHDIQEHAPARRLVYHRQCGQWGSHPIPLAWHPHQPLLATGSTLDETRLHDVTIWTPNGILHTHLVGNVELWQIGWSWDGRVLGSVADRITLWTPDGHRLHQLPGHRMLWNPTTYHLVTSTLRDRQWWLWNLEAGTQHALPTPPDSRQAHVSLVWSPQGTYLLGAWNALNGTITLRLWSRDGAMLGQMAMDASVVGPVLGTVWHPDEAHVVLLTEDEMLLLDLQATVLQRFPTAVNHDAGWTQSTPCRWSPDGRVLAAASGSTVQLWSTTGQALATLPLRAEAVTVTWTPDSAILVTASRSMQMELWTPTGEKVGDVALANVELGPRSMRIPYTLAWDAQGQYLATALRGRTVHVWTWAD